MSTRENIRLIARAPLVFFTVFLKNRKIISKIKRSKVTDYVALKWHSQESSIEIRAQKS